MIALLIYIAEGINLEVKELVGRPQPEFSLLENVSTTQSFPSGHTVHAIVSFGYLGVLAAELIRSLWLARLVQALLWLTVLGVGASRVYLGAHCPATCSACTCSGAPG